MNVACVFFKFGPLCLEPTSGPRWGSRAAGRKGRDAPAGLDPAGLEAHAAEGRSLLFHSVSFPAA